MTKSMIDGGMSPGCSDCSDQDAASALAQGHPKSGKPPVGYGQRSRTNDGDGPDDNARDPSFEK